MPFANIKVIENVFSDGEKQQIIENVTDALVAVEGKHLRDKTVVIVEEVKSADWGIGGKLMTSREAKDLRTTGVA
jgi:4-oxalocrotonate tautomerase